ncbi:dTDP-4-dehydrorhamnose 3,5-epimerase [Pseudorhizobium pelagicum]|uniref:dTDP-4-dehydrorhamnose 3,5-epimerase n=1 Tax=Pseudorhizobium pelagicum TaxID=1509405 RepID=A0A922P1A3_9HYPH|nr:dTDP-4-dehydrorhamnose 3,5-epimerase [Pseudorhizobium pelagicum]KEQ04514.1 dTDP-4-dehydrorhamnose 3,5-epimerase [Pseudorhizobium pelagicum]KEQ06674.1 dTDP-4-dehydrorhamnose 3,5-epimerase [Pseudorhizobium pelagicum]
MRIEATSLRDVIKITPRHFNDSRGYFCELYREEWFRKEVADVRFVQDNQSLSWRDGTLRGLHFQRAPAAQGKLVRVIAGAIFDVALDARPSSETFGQWTAVELSEDNHAQLWIPEGFAHGFLSLSPRTVVQYKVTAPYNPAAETGVIWNDPDLAINWPLTGREIHISSKDAYLPRLRDLVTPVLPMKETA